MLPAPARTGVLAAGVGVLDLASRLPGADVVSLREYARPAASPTERAHLAAFVDTVRHARPEILEGCGHFPRSDEPDRFVALLTEFCDADPPAALDVGSMGPRLAAREAM